MTKRYLIVVAGIGFAALTHAAEAMPRPALLFSLHTADKPAAATRPADVPKDERLIHFCGENVPTNHPAITDRWTRTISHQAALAADLALLKRRASVVFPLIEPILTQYRIPSDFKYLPLLESAVTNRAVSRRGAAGFWQLMPQTAQSLGLAVSNRNDERFNLIKATHAACRYIRELYDELGSWMLVATAYNAGPNYIHQLVRQYPDTHPMALPYRANETKAYLFQAVAVKELLTRPQLYSDQLGSRAIDLLAGGDLPLETGERTAILTSFDMDEATVKRLNSQALADQMPAFVMDSTTSVVLLTEEESTTGIVSKTVASAAATAKKDVATPAKPVEQAAAPVARLKTRSLSEGPLTEGKLCMFQVIQPITLNGRSFGVGDIIHAFIDVIDTQSGRVYLRTDRLVTAQTQETFPLRLVATERPKQPGVPLPGRLENWQLTWEML